MVSADPARSAALCVWAYLTVYLQSSCYAKIQCEWTDGEKQYHIVVESVRLPQGIVTTKLHYGAAAEIHCKIVSVTV